jgi:hypothetical protein
MQTAYCCHLIHDTESACDFDCSFRDFESLALSASSSINQLSISERKKFARHCDKTAFAGQQREALTRKLTEKEKERPATAKERKKAQRAEI